MPNDRTGSQTGSQTGHTWRNWMGNLECRPTRQFRPTTLAELQTIVKQAADEGRRVRAFGSGHSWMPLVPTDDFLIDNQGLNRCLEVDKTKHTIRVEGGMTLRELTVIAQAAGLSVQSPTVATQFTVAGMVATGSHGSGMNVETFPDSVVSMTMVNAKGDVVEIGNDDPDMPFARVALGTLGLIYAVTLSCPPATNIKCTTKKIPVSEMLGQLQAIVHGHDCVMLMWYPYTKNVIAMYYDKTDEPLTFGPLRHRLNALVQYIVEGVIGRPFLALTLKISPRLMKWPMRLASALTPQSVKVETQIDGVHWQFVYPLVWDSSWAVPLADAADAWRVWMEEIDAFQQRDVYPITMVMFARFVKASGSPLSPAYGRDTCFVEATSLKETPGTIDYYQAVEDKMIARFDGRPHWAKYFHDLDRVREQSRDSLIATEAVRKRWDPDGRFMNTFLAKVFAPFDSHRHHIDTGHIDTGHIDTGNIDPDLIDTAAVAAIDTAGVDDE